MKKLITYSIILGSILFIISVNITLAQKSICPEGQITESCVCGQKVYSNGYCCNNSPQKQLCKDGEKPPIEKPPINVDKPPIQIKPPCESCFLKPEIKKLKKKYIAQTDEYTLSSKAVLFEVNNKVYFEKNGQNFELPIQPDSAIDIAVASINPKIIKGIELKTGGGNPVYEVKSKKPFKLFGFIPASITVKTEIDANTGEITKEKKSWYSFLGKVQDSTLEPGSMGQSNNECRQQCIQEFRDCVSNNHGNPSGLRECNEQRGECIVECSGIEKPIYILWLNHFKDPVNIGDDARILNDLLDLYEANDLPVEWTFNGAMLQALKDGVKWPKGHGHSPDEWLSEPNPALIAKLQQAGRNGAVFSNFGDVFMPNWAQGMIKSGALTSFDQALELEMERNKYYRDVITGAMNKNIIGGQFEIFNELFGDVYTFLAADIEPQRIYASKLMGGRFGADKYEMAEFISDIEGPWYWYMGIMHYSIYAPNLLDAATHWLPTAGTKQIDEDIAAMKAYVSGSNTKYGAMYAGAHTHSIYMQGCMNAGEWDYDNPPNEECELSPYKPGICELGSYSLGSLQDITAPDYDTSCYQYLNAIDHVPTDWYEMMFNPVTHPSPEVVQEGRRDEIYQRNIDYITKFVEKLTQTVQDDPQITIVTRETVLDLVQPEEGRQINKDTINQIANFLTNNWTKERPPSFVTLINSSSAVDGGSDYYTLGESYRLLHESLTSYDQNGVLPDTVENDFVLAPTGLGRKDDAQTSIRASFKITDIIQTANSISPINKYGDYQIDDEVVVNGREINPAEFLLLMAKAYKLLNDGQGTDAEIAFTGSKITTSFSNQKNVRCVSDWCPYQGWTFKPAKFIGQ